MVTENEHYWRVIAVTAVVLAAGFVGLMGIDKFRTWSREDSVENAKEEVQQRKVEALRRTREVAAARARQFESQMAETSAAARRHPERFHKFPLLPGEVSLGLDMKPSVPKRLATPTLPNQTLQKPDMGFTVPEWAMRNHYRNEVFKSFEKDPRRKLYENYTDRYRQHNKAVLAKVRSGMSQPAMMLAL